jgi:hypothetical protein
VPFWLRSDLDGTQAKEVLADAARAGINSPIVFAHVALPRKDELVRAIITREAAERTLVTLVSCKRLKDRKHATRLPSKSGMRKSASMTSSNKR